VEDVVKHPNEDIDLERWEAQAPPDDFADRVLAQITASTAAEPKPEPRDVEPVVRQAPSVSFFRRPAVWAGAATTMALAAAVLLGVGGPPAEGEAIAADRTEVAIGKRGVAVLEPGASVRWSGDEVTQSRGDVFYRVERGARFRVHTPAGDVEVKGTCFTVKVREESDMHKRDVKSGFVGAALTGLAFVAVYEGKVAVSHAAERVDLIAGQGAQLGPKGIAKSGLSEGEQSFEANAAADKHDGDEPLMTANQRLAHQVGEYRSRLEAVVAQKADLETKLKRSEESLAATQDGAPAPTRHDFDLSQDDWKRLAKEGTVKYQMPCMNKGDSWSPSADKLQTLGLAPQDAATIKNAYAHSQQRIWSTIKPMCTQVVGTPEVAEKLGAETCMFLVMDAQKEAMPKVDGMDATGRAIRQVAEMRAGMRPMPGTTDDADLSTKIMLMATGANKAFEDELAQSFGPEEAHRLVFSDELCMQSSVFRTQPKKKGGSMASDAMDDIPK
jgi:ferric-dicitrate binding protein FerR (iron transport regulator)